MFNIFHFSTALFIFQSAIILVQAEYASPSSKATIARVTRNLANRNVSNIVATTTESTPASSSVTSTQVSCSPFADPDYDATPVCQCDDGKQYAMLSQGTTRASLFQPCGYAATPQTTAASNPSKCEFDGPSNCTTNTAVCTWNLEGQWPEFYEDTYPQQGSYMLPACAAEGVDVPLGYLGWWLHNGATCESEEQI
uniref:Uncharacterized protein n=1 Tax=Cladonia uncialis subsp. uncialis TaxID=180999 RepID=A0A2K9YDK8_CLAUC|nr:hypothetical protein [Cladonia uncialis subsp. uncialis]